VCTLVIIGVRADGKKELVALTDGHRESTESWAGLLRDAKRRGMRAPVLAVGDGALGFWAALREVFPQTKEQRDWVHKAMNVLDCLPTSAQPAARKALAQIRDAEDREHAEEAVKDFAAAYGAKYHKAAAKITDDADQLLAFFDFPAEHWVHLKPVTQSNPPSPPYGCGPGSPRARAAAPPGWRWCSSSSRRPANAGATSTARTWSPWSGPARSSRREYSSSGQTRPAPRSPRDQSGHAVHNS
jgi:Transposase, Mutator family